jgi:tyrosine-protein kinase Etk/Wzc
MESRSNPVLDFLLLLLGRKRMVLALVLPTMLIVAVYSLVMEKTYQSSALIVPPAGSSSPLAGILGDLPMSDLLGGFAGLSAGGGAEYYLAILNSRVLREGLLEEFDLRRHYSMEKAKIEDVFEVMGERIHSELNFDSGMLELRVQDKDPVLARDMARWMIDRLEDLNRDYRTRRARNSREFVHGEVAKVRAELDSLEQDLVSFQRRQRVLEPEGQAQAVLGRYGEIKAQEAVKELELRLASRLRGPAHPEIRRLESELTAIREQLKAGYELGDSDFFLAVADLPEATVDFLRRKRELEIAGKKLIFLLPQLEQAKIEEVNDTPVLEILDPPRVAEKRIKPKRTLMVLAAGLISMLVASLLALLLDRMERDPALAGQLTRVGGHLRRLLRLKLD